MALTKIKTGSVSDSITLTTPTISGVLTANAGVVVDNFTLDGTTLALSSGDMTLDAAGRIDLSADDGGEIRFFDGSSMYGQIKDDDDRLKIQGLISNKAMLLVGNDGGSEVTMLLLDAENAGNATFNGTVLASNGTAALPSLSFSGDSNTGIYRPNADNLGFAIGGVARAFMSAGQFNMSGAIVGTSKSFRINHPLPAKKDTHYLVHASLEGPQLDLIYRGIVNLVGGSATVNIDTAAGMTDGTFVLLNTNVQCFTSNESGWTAIKGSVSGNTLTITAQDNACTDTISWMVVGERQDLDLLDT